MSKRSVVIAATILFVLAVVTAAIAADPSAGTWKLNLGRSKFPSTVKPPQEQTVVKQEVGEDFEVAITGVQSDGKPFITKYVHPVQGGLMKNQNATEGTILVVTVASPGDVYTTFLQNGKQVRVHHNTISSDGKMMTETQKYINRNGQPIDAVLIYDRQ